MDVFAQIPLGLLNRYLFIQIGLIMIILPFAFAYFLEMQKELMKIQGSNYSLMQWTDAQPCFEAPCSIQLILSSHYQGLFPPALSQVLPPLFRILSGARSNSYSIEFDKTYACKED